MTRLIMARSRGRSGSPHEAKRSAGRPRRAAMPPPDFADAPSGLRALLVGAGEIGEQAGDRVARMKRSEARGDLAARQCRPRISLTLHPGYVRYLLARAKSASRRLIG